MSTLAADAVAFFDFTFPAANAASPMPSSYESLLDVPYRSSSSSFLQPPSHSHHGGHSRSSSSVSAYSFVSSAPSDSFLSSTSTSSLGSVATPPGSARSTPAPAEACSTPAKQAGPVIRTHGPMLLPKIRSQDQALGDDADHLLPAAPPAKRARTSSSGGRSLSVSRRAERRPAASGARHVRSFTSPGALLFEPGMGPALAPAPAPAPVFHTSTPVPPTLLCSPAPFSTAAKSDLDRRASSCRLDGDFYAQADDYDFAGYHHNGNYGYPYAYAYGGCGFSLAPSVEAEGSSDNYRYAEPGSDSYRYAAANPGLALQRMLSPPPSATPEPMPCSQALPATTSVLEQLTAANPAPGLVRSLAFPLRDPQAKHYWWDVRQVRAWSAFTASNLLALPGARAVLSSRVPTGVFPAPSVQQHPSGPPTEADLLRLCAAHYLPRVNTALALSSPRPVQLAEAPLPAGAGTGGGGAAGSLFVGTAPGDSSSAAALFGGKPVARVVGLVLGFDRFNTGMRAEGNVRRVEYLRALAQLQYLMREHGCRYGFLLSEIELVVVRSGVEPTPLFGKIEVATVGCAATAATASTPSETGPQEPPLTASLALWALCMLASDEMAAAAAAAQASPSPDSLLCAYTAHIGAPAEGTRRLAAPRDSWMPTPQLAEKRAAKRARGWVLPEDPIGRKELGRRGVRYGR